MMRTGVVAERVAGIVAMLGPLFRFVTESRYARRVGDPAICDFVFGNPHDAPLEGFVAALVRWSLPQNKDWYAYKMSEPEATSVVAAALRERRGAPFEEEDVFLTNGAFAALSVTLAAISDPGDEVIFISPPWFFYEALIVACGARPVRVRVTPDTFDLDLDAIAAAITEHTRAVIVNSPNNPTGRIYSPETLGELGHLLGEASARIGHTIYLLSDEAYSRILFDGRPYHSPTTYYPHSFLIYTYGKTLLTPGQRLGYVALPPTMPERGQLRPALLVSQLMTGYAFPNALLQHALSDIEQLSIGVDCLELRRDRLVSALRGMGYETNVPEGTFYLLVRSPLKDDLTFSEMLAGHDIFCLPGALFEMPGYFRISLTANDEMIEQALPGFAAVIQQAQDDEVMRRGGQPFSL
ncbi:MAG: aminotransferase class I/II-fold pyridoxal phosphate-dependent enzyme [Ardenticatenaceae bacterium]